MVPPTLVISLEAVLSQDAERFTDDGILESLRVLREYGFKGYYESWGDHKDFPLATFLALMGIGSECKDDDSIKSCFEDECRLIMELTKKTK